MPENSVEDLLAAAPLALAALKEITPEATIGEPVGHVVEADGVVSLLFESRLPGYPGWRWTVTLTRTEEDAEPTVLEAELMPGDDALLAPDWVPWSERLAEYQAAQEALAAEAVPDEDEDADADADDEDADDADYDDDRDDEDEDSDDFDDEEEDSDEDDDRDIHDLHGDDDVDGVDIDSVDVGFDEVTDVDPELDLEAEEAAALEDSAPAAFDAEVDEAGDAEGDADEDGPEPEAATVGEERAGEDEDRHEGDDPEA